MHDTTQKKHFLTPKSQSISQWYNAVVLQAELADYAPVKGCMVIRPYGYAIWEAIQQYLDRQFKQLGVQNAYFPLFIPESLLKREKEHLKGFSPELAVVTIAGGEKLKEPLIVRPTSETIAYTMYAKWIKSHRDLPLLLNFWNSVVRWEKRTYLFLRTTEFLWQEGHTVHATNEDADNFARKILELYRVFDEHILSIPVIAGKKSKAEKFAGAQITYTLEALMPDGKALQMGTSHNLGDNFSKVFDIQYQDKEGTLQYAWQTSWAETTRVIGALIMVHGDDQGLVLPPKLAPTKVVIIPVLGKDDEAVLGLAKKIKAEIDKMESHFPGSVEIWGDPEKTFGWKANEAELKGIPLTIPVGPKEVNGEKPFHLRFRLKNDGESELSAVEISIDTMAQEVEKALETIQKQLLHEAKEFLQANIRIVNSYEEFKEIMNTTRGFIRAFWCEDSTCEAKIKAETKASTRLLPLDAKEEKGSCVYCGKEAHYRWYFAQAY